MTGLLISILLLLVGLAHATVTTVRITSNTANKGRPDVHGNIIVWKDYRNGNWDAYMYDLDSKEERAVSFNPSYQNVPVTNGSIIVWEDNRAGNNDIYFRSVAAGALEKVLVSGPGNQGLPVISGNTVVYVDDRSGSNDIYAIDVTTDLTPGGITAVCTDAASQWQPRVNGTRVIWEDNRSGSWDIYMKDLAGGAEQAVTLDENEDRVADIYSDRVVWRRKNDDGVYDIWMKKLELVNGVLQGDPQPLTSDAAYQNSPRISGDLVVWENYDYQRKNWDVFIKDLTSGVVSTIAGGLATEARPAVDRETVVWQANDATGYSIWMAHVPDTTPPAVNEKTPADGSSPGCGSPVISASYSDNRAGVDAGSVRLLLDGEDVTADASVSATGVSWHPPRSLSDGTHTASLAVADHSGNTRSESWQFATAVPGVRLAAVKSYWASLNDYLNRELSVQIRLTNTSTGVNIADAGVISSSATAGVVMLSPLPVDMGYVQAGASADAVLKYKVPAGTTFFRTVVYIGCADACGDPYYFPGPPPDR